MPVVWVQRVGQHESWHGELADGDTIGRAKSCSITLDDPAVAELHAIVRLPDRGDDIAFYLQPGASATIDGEVRRGRAALCTSRCTVEIGPFTIAIAQIDTEVPTDFSIRFDEPVETPAHDAVESELLASIRARPSDDAVREVYADWLEQHGFALRAGLLRAETLAAQPGTDIDVRVDTLAPAADHAWRAITSRAPIDRCVMFKVTCPKKWSALAATSVDRVRHCAVCDRRVHYCTSVEEARAHGRQNHCIAIDAAVARGEALAAYDHDPADDTMEMGEVA